MVIPTLPNPEVYQLVVLISMAVMIALKIYVMYYDAKTKNPEITFNPGYILTGITGVFMAFSAYMAFIPYGDTLIITAIGAAASAIGGTLTIEFVGKSIQKPTEKVIEPVAPTPIPEPPKVPPTP